MADEDCLVRDWKEGDLAIDKIGRHWKFLTGPTKGAIFGDTKWYKITAISKYTGNTGGTYNVSQMDIKNMQLIRYHE